MWVLQIGLFGIGVLGLPFSKIVFSPTGLRRGDFDFLVPPGRLPAAGGTDYSLQREGKGKTHQGHICITSIPHCNRGVKGGGAPHEGEKTKIRKADADKTDNQYVQGVQGRFYLSSHF